jgi:diguanylate cyclase (GGDEF)-like protein
VTFAVAAIAFVAGLAAGAAIMLLLARARAARLERAASHELGQARRDLALAQKTLDDLARTDVLTGVANRRRAEERLAEEWPRHARSSQPLSALMIELDYFKPYNNAYGARQGDACLKQIASVFGAAVGRAADLVARWGGEKFLVLLPETPSDGAKRVADNLRQRVEALQFPHEASKRKIVTISVGVATFSPSPSTTADSLVASADDALQRAKRSGRNTVSE